MVVCVNMCFFIDFVGDFVTVCLPLFLLALREGDINGLVDFVTWYCGFN